jgi:hypothetical protein
MLARVDSRTVRFICRVPRAATVGERSHESNPPIATLTRVSLSDESGATSTALHGPPAAAPSAWCQL